jgi:hypothetical protein
MPTTNIKFGISNWNKEAPKIIYRIGDTLYSIAIALSTYSLVGGQQWAIKLGTGCLISGILLERISGLTTLNKPVETNVISNTNKQGVQVPKVDIKESIK